MSLDNMSGSKLGRFLTLSRMTASVAGSYFGTRLANTFAPSEGEQSRIDNTHTKVGRRMARTLGELKGPLMKLGQMASLSSGLLPARISEALAVLRKDAPSVPYSVIAKQVESELGAPPERLFSSFEREPYAAASIGQVHRAITDDGRDVVVKVQYPDITNSLDADLAHLRFALKAAGALRRNKEGFDRFYDEMSAHLREELDYCNEAENARFLAEFHNGRHPFVHIPEVIGEQSSERVLTLTFEGGCTLEEARSLDQSVRDLIGERLIELLYSEIFDLGTIHADPNPANFAFRPDGTFALYDFGCIQRLSNTELAGIRGILKGALERDYAAIEQGLLAIGARNPDTPPLSNSAYDAMFNLLSPLLDPQEPFNVGSSTIHKTVLKQVPKLKKHINSFRLTAGLMLIQRVNVGYYGNLRALGSRVRCREIIESAVMAKSARVPESFTVSQDWS
jgi:predicted unusual protein kinase regulating ubiquinone biosynthesis (AarF/ABC1/UbiB family)